MSYEAKKTVAIIFGGKSVEHEVSIKSAINIIRALDKELFDFLPIAIDKNGIWYHVHLDKLYECFSLQENLSIEKCREILLNKVDLNALAAITDIAFPIVHGKIGEDGCLQGLLNTLGIAFVGSDVLSSCLCMDKEMTKRVLSFEKIPVAKYMYFTSVKEVNLEEVIENLNLPVFVKPSNSGSSVGIFKAKNKKELKDYIAKAFELDHKILVEEAIDGWEIECAVLGNEHLEASLPVRIIPSHEFYDYEAKYVDPNGAVFEVPVKVSCEWLKKIQDLAKKTYKVLGCQGFARIDFFLTYDKKLYVNEANTLPGFTNISMYPKMWEVSGLCNKDLITHLIHLGLQRHEKNQRLINNLENIATEKTLILKS